MPGPAKQWVSTSAFERGRRHPKARPDPPVGRLASTTKPKHPSSQSQSLSRSYGSNLPTSLTYIILSTRGCSPRRPAADMGTSWCDSAVTLSLIFKVPPGTRGHRENCGVLRQTKTHSPCERIPGPRQLMQKRKLFPELRRTSQTHFVLPRRIRGSETVPRPG